VGFRHDSWRQPQTVHLNRVMVFIPMGTGARNRVYSVATSEKRDDANG